MKPVSGTRRKLAFNFSVFYLTAVLLLLIMPGTAFGAKPVCGNDICEGNESRTCQDDCPATDPDPDPPPSSGTESCGCDTGLTSSAAKAGRSYVRELTVPGSPTNPTTKYEVRLPSNYKVSTDGGHPVLVYLHGWGGNYRSLPTQFARHAKASGYIVVTPTGYGDGGLNSWNGIRSAKLPGCPPGPSAEDCNAGPPSGPSTCVDIDDSRFNYCYDSCGECPKWDGSTVSNTWNQELDIDFNGDYTCYWTTCLDSVAQIEALLDVIEQDYCVDRSMVWVTGCSNGGMFLYELAKDGRTANRFAGYLPQVGSPHPGFQQENQSLAKPPGYFMGFWGESDTTVPGKENFAPGVALDTSSNGWLYMTADSIVQEWVSLNGGSHDVSYDAREYSSTLDCKAWKGDDSEIVECFFPGGHSCPGFGDMPRMMWDFATQHPNIELPVNSCQ